MLDIRSEVPLKDADRTNKNIGNADLDQEQSDLGSKTVCTGLSDCPKNTGKLCYTSIGRLVLFFALYALGAF